MFMDKDIVNNAVMKTSIDAIAGKLSCHMCGYTDDPYILLVVKYLCGNCRLSNEGEISRNLTQNQIKEPIINRGYYTRVRAFEDKILGFLNKHKDVERTVISLGAGFDTTYFRLTDTHFSLVSDPKVVFIEIDFPSIIQQKTEFIQTMLSPHDVKDSGNGLGQLSRQTGTVKIGDRVTSCYTNHFLIGADITDLSAVEEALKSVCVLPSKGEYLITSECVFAYIDPNKIDCLLLWLATTFNNCQLFIYDMMNPFDHFGRMMVKNIKESKGCTLPGMLAYPTLKMYKERLVVAGFTFIEAMSVNSFFAEQIEQVEIDRIDQIERLDEVEEWEIINEHYLYAYASVFAKDFAETIPGLDADIQNLSENDIRARTRMIDSEVKMMQNELSRIRYEKDSLKEQVNENKEKIKINKQLPYLVANVVELLDINPDEDANSEGGNVDLDAQRKGKCAVIKTSTRQTIFLPVIGLVRAENLKPSDLVGVNKDSYLILDKLPAEYDSRVKAMEVDEKPTEDYNDVGGLDKQIQELVEAVVLPMTDAERFKKIGISAPKGCLLYGPPGTGKTLMARACAAQTNATFLKLAGPQLVQMFIGDGAKLVRDAFALAKEKAPTIIFIDELDAIGTKRFDSEKSGDREVQRTMLELLNQLDGFASDDRIKVIAATNRIDTLDPALMRSGRLDRKIEFPLPTEKARADILQIHSRKMTVCTAVNFDELARCTEDFNGAQLKAVCVEAGMIALRRDASQISHEDFMDAIQEVMSKKKANLNYYA